MYKWFFFFTIDRQIPKHNHITSDTPEQSQNRVMNRCREHFKTSYIKHAQDHDCQLLRHHEINLIGNT